MKATVDSLLFSWLAGVSLALLYVVAASSFAERRIPLDKLWMMGVLQVATIVGTLLALLLSPLVHWALRNGGRGVVFRGGMLWVFLALYLLGTSFTLVWLKREDVHGVWSMLVPLILSVLGLVYIGQTRR